MTGDSPREPSQRTRSPPSRGRGSRHWLWALVVAALLVGAAVPAASYDTARLDRMSGIDVVTDTDALLGIDHAQTVTDGSTLVVVTNRFAEERVVTVALTSCTDRTLSLTTTGENSSGVLVSNDGSSVTFSLPAGGSQAVIIEGLTGPQCSPIQTRITTTDGLTQVIAEREATAERGTGNGGGGPPDNPGNGNANLATGVLGDD